MTSIVETFMNRYGDWQQAVVEHLQLSVMSLLVAMIIAIPLAIFLTKYKKTAEVVLQVTGVLQTLPSLAILGLLIPFVGIGTVPAVVTLVVYGLFPIVQNTITAFWELDPALEEAATAFGMTRWEKLRKYQLALALPVMMSGVRTAAVMIVGTATLAALIGAGGLGSFILLGIDRNDSALLLIGAISSAILAIVISFVLRVLEKKRLKTILVTFAAVFVAVGASFAAPVFQSMTADKIVIAGKLGAEPDILINMYKLLIEQDSNVTVELKPNFGKTTFLYEALKSGSVDIYPEFTGTITTSLLTEAPEVSTDEATVYQQARDGIYAQDKLVYLKPMQYENTYALATTKTFARANNLKTITDLTRLSNVRAGFTLEFNDREDGNKGLQSLYGLNLDVQTFEPALRYQAIANGQVDVVDVYSTDSQIITNDLQLLEDDKHLFPPYQGAPLLREDTLKKHPELEGILNQLAGKITSQEMAMMNYQVDVQGMSAEQVAKDYLQSQGLLK